MINSALQIPFHTPVITGVSTTARPAIDSPELDTTTDISAAIDDAIDEAIARGNEQAPVLAANLLRMINENPEALDLYLANVSEQRQRNLTSALSITAYASDNAANSPSDPLGSFGKVLETVSKRNDEANGNTLGSYTKYMVALTELSTRINGLITASTKEKEEGKSNVNSLTIIDAIREFTDKWEVKENDINVLGVFDKKNDAEEAAKRFRGGTVEAFEDSTDGKFKLRFSFAKLIPIISSLINNDTDQTLLKQITKNMHNGGGPVTRNDNGWPSDISKLKSIKVNSHGIQTISLALADVQKTHQTDLDLVLNEFTRQTSQFDNLVKLYSSLATALTETLKSFL